MELSVAASGVAFASIALQLVDSVKKLCEFWSSIKEAPEDILFISVDLQVLSGVVTNIASEGQHHVPDAAVIAALVLCDGKVKTLIAIVTELEPGFESKSLRVRKWTAFKVVFKSDKLKKFRESLEGMKTTLILALQVQHSHLHRIGQEAQQHRITTIVQAITDLRLQSIQGFSESVMMSSNTSLGAHDPLLCGGPSHVTHPLPTHRHSSVSELKMDGDCQEVHGSTRHDSLAGDMELTNIVDSHGSQGSISEVVSTLNYFPPSLPTWRKRLVHDQVTLLRNFFGTVYMHSKGDLLESSYPNEDSICSEDHHEYTTSLSLFPSQWLVKFGLHYGLRLGFSKSSIDGWKFTPSVFYPVADDALIFEFCEQGNISGVKTLFSRGQASVWDTNSLGKTALHFAAGSTNVQLCKLLIEAGANTNARDFRRRSPLLAATDSSGNHVLKATTMIDTLRLFSDSMDFSDKSSDGWRAIVDLCYLSTSPRKGNPEILTTVLWAMYLTSSDITEHYDKRWFECILLSLMGHRCYGWSRVRFHEIIRVLLTISNKVINAGQHHGYFPLHHLTGFTRSENSARGNFYRGMLLLLKKGANPHLVGSDTVFSPHEETPTSIAMYNSAGFTALQDALQELSVDLDVFMEEELQHGRQKDAGWEKDSLLALFRHKIGCKQPPGIRKCSRCLRSLGISNIHVEPCWLKWIERFKNRRELASQSDCERDFSNEADDGQGSHNEKGNKPSMSGSKTPVTWHSRVNPTDREVDFEAIEFATNDSQNNDSEEGFFDAVSIGNACSCGPVFECNEFWCIWCWMAVEEPDKANHWEEMRMSPEEFWGV